MKYTLWLFVFLFCFIGCDETNTTHNDTEAHTADVPKSNPQAEDTELTPKAPLQYGKRKQSFDLGKKTYSISPYVTKTVFKSYDKEPRVFTYTGDLPPDWESQYYDMYLNHAEDKKLMNNILEQIRNLEPTWKGDDLVELIVAYVQGGLVYDWKQLYAIDQNLNYPYETVYKGKGVCSDKSILLAGLLDKLGYKFVLLQFPRANHLAVGIKVPEGYGQFGTEYCFIETTNYARIGIIPEEYHEGVQLDPNPRVIPLGSGTREFSKIAAYKKEEEQIRNTYGEDYLFASAEQKRMLEELHELDIKKKKAERTVRKMGCEGNLSEAKYNKCQKAIEKVNKYVDAYNELVNKYNKSLKKDK